MYPTQLSYLQPAPLHYTYPNYCMLPPVYNSMVAPNTPTNTVINNTNNTEDPRDTRDNVLVTSSSVASVPDTSLSTGEAGSEAGEERSDYMEELSRERDSLEHQETGHARRLLDREISLLQSGQTHAPTNCEVQMVDVYREKPIRLVVKVTVPVKEHPKFNFVGKLLGPKGNSLKRLQEETLTKMAVLGKGSMRDKAKEEEMRLSKDPKYNHLNEDLHVEIVAFAPPAEAHARMSYALTEVRKYLIPDSNDTIRQLQMKELEILNSSEKMLGDPGTSMQLLKTVTNPLQSMQPLLVPSTSYLPSPHLSLLPTPPLDSVSPTIAAPPTKYETEQVVDSAELGGRPQLKMTDNKRADRRRDVQPY